MLPSNVRKRSRWHDEEISENKSNEKQKIESGSLNYKSKESSIIITQENKDKQIVNAFLKDLNCSKPDKTQQISKNPKPNLILKSCRSVDYYKKLNRIDEGTYGIVYRAREIETGEIVALKKLKVLHNGKYGFPITALREIHTLLMYKHRHIVNVREIAIGGSTTPSVFIVMEFIDHDLKGVLNTMPRNFSISEVKTLMIQLLDAVNHLHENMVIHRDLKTSNLLMNNQGEMKVADFGLARLLADESNGPRALTKPVVTLWYRAPELLLGASFYTTKVDIWSVGCIFAELLTREVLFSANTEIGMLKCIFEMLGSPNQLSQLHSLPNSKTLNFSSFPSHSGKLRSDFGTSLTKNGMDLLENLLELDPQKRITASQALSSEFFRERPVPLSKRLFPTFPARAANERVSGSPKAPIAGHGEAEEMCTEIAPSAFRLRV